MCNSENSAMQISIISNIVFEPFFSFFIKKQFGDNTQIYTIPYSEYKNTEQQIKFKQSSIIVVWINIESLYLNLSNELVLQSEVNPSFIEETIVSCKKLYADISRYSNAHIMWFLFEDYYNTFPTVLGHDYYSTIDFINAQISNQLSCNVSFIDLKRLIAEVGVLNTYDFKGKYRWNAPYTKALIEVAVKEMFKRYLIEYGITKNV